MNLDERTALMAQARFGRKRRVEAGKAMVVSSDPLATRAGLDVLREGGNACDAVLAAAAMQLVTEPHMTSITGGLSMMYWDAASGEAAYLNGNISAPLAELPGFSGADLYTGRGVPVPGWWPAFEAARQRWGRTGRARLMRDAIEVAREGFPMDPYLYGVMYGRQEGIGVHVQGREVFWPQGHLLTQGETVVQARVARTLERLRDEGMDYYNGDFARAFSAECQRGGGVIVPEDLRAYRPMFQRPVQGTYRDRYTVIGSPAPDDGGMMLVEALNLLEHVDLARLGPASESFETLQWLIRVHNEVYYAPPRQGDLDSAPVETGILLSKEYAARRFELMRVREPRATGVPMPTPGTIHLAAVDKDGNIASCTHSHMASGWPNGLFAEGFQLSGGGSFFQRILPQPGARATVYLAPNIVLRDGRPVIVSGSPSVSLVACVLQNLVNLMDFGMDIEASVHQPRFGARPHNPQNGWERGNTLESDFAPQMQERFVAWARERRLWHQRVHPRCTLTGNFEAITLDPASGLLASCADPRRCGSVEGY
ncbi:gamma-glutamyltransferase [Luteimonas wenzhouensis]|uniref:gamma-glutamyltransferase n=1 Tax=Luteimonas wenzhouensis TaxID=2599615 RepID=UPI001C96140C|nr:gamma-glutamyltransferase [Luteimonas wenzhouensis]